VAADCGVRKTAPDPEGRRVELNPLHGGRHPFLTRVTKENPMPRRAHDADPAARNALMEFLHLSLTEQQYLKAEQLVKAMADISSTEQDSNRLNGAMDSRSMAYDMSATSAGRIVADREVAIREVEGTVGRDTVLACDSAASVFRAALSSMGIDARNLHRDALPEVFRGHARQRRIAAGGGGYSAPMAMDARGSADFARRFPDLARIRVL
jgi:hypothetical protein